jgi:hypothetical protein
MNNTQLELDQQAESFHVERDLHSNENKKMR